jgi:hypothetical protein
MPIQIQINKVFQVIINRPLPLTLNYRGAC